MPSFMLYKTANGAVVDGGGSYYAVEPSDWDALLNADDLIATLQAAITRDELVDGPATLQAPLGTQEVWAAGVTYWRSRDARMSESQATGGATFYDRVYEAERPELFCKATAHRVVGSGGMLRLRSDAKWIVPEPELVLVINRRGQIVGYTIGNDLSCRDIEAENPLYLPQAKTFDGCAGVGPGVLVTRDPLPVSTEIQLSIVRAGAEVFAGATTLSQLRRSPSSLVEWLFREASFPVGCLLFTGTGIVPPDDFTLASGDEVRIAITGIGALVNTVQ